MSDVEPGDAGSDSSGQTESLGRDSGISSDSLDHRHLSPAELPPPPLLPPQSEEPEDDEPEGEEAEWREFSNLRGLSGDLRFLAGMPELCDVMFVVGEEREPVYGVKAVLAIRSRVFYKMLYGPKSTSERARGLNGVQVGSGNVARRISRFFSDAAGPNIRASLSHSNLLRESSGSEGGRTMVVVEEFEAEVFKELLTFIHTGAVTLRPRTLLGLMNAADHFGIEDLRKACAGFSGRVVSLQTVCSLLLTAENYIQYKSTKIFIQRVLEFVEENGEAVLKLPELVHLPRHVLELLLSREGLRAQQLTKYRAAERWARHHILEHPSLSLRELMRPLVRHVGFAGIPTAVLVREIQPLAVVPDNLLMAALAYQADPGSIDDEVYTASNPGTPTMRSSCSTSENHGAPRSRSQERARLFELVGSSRLESTSLSPLLSDRRRSALLSPPTPRKAPMAPPRPSSRRNSVAGDGRTVLVIGEADPDFSTRM